MLLRRNIKNFYSKKQIMYELSLIANNQSDFSWQRKIDVVEMGAEG